MGFDFLMVTLCEDFFVALIMLAMRSLFGWSFNVVNLKVDVVEAIYTYECVSGK